MYGGISINSPNKNEIEYYRLTISLKFTYLSWCSNSCMIMLAIGSVMGRSPSNRCRSGSACIWAKEPSPKVISKWGEMETLSSSAAINHQTVGYRIKPLIRIPVLQKSSNASLIMVECNQRKKSHSKMGG